MREQGGTAGACRLPCRSTGRSSLRAGSGRPRRSMRDHRRKEAAQAWPRPTQHPHLGHGVTAALPRHQAARVVHDLLEQHGLGAAHHARGGQHHLAAARGGMGAREGGGSAPQQGHTVGSSSSIAGASSTLGQKTPRSLPSHTFYRDVAPLQPWLGAALSPCLPSPSLTPACCPPAPSPPLLVPLHRDPFPLLLPKPAVYDPLRRRSAPITHPGPSPPQPTLPLRCHPHCPRPRPHPQPRPTCSPRCAAPQSLRLHPFSPAPYPQSPTLSPLPPCPPPAVHNALRQRVRTEASEHHTVHRANACAGQLRENKEGAAGEHCVCAHPCLKRSSRASQCADQLLGFARQQQAAATAAATVSVTPLPWCRCSVCRCGRAT